MTDEMDRLQFALTARDSRLVVLGTLPGGCWACLPRGWRQMKVLHGLACDPRIELMPDAETWPGEIGVDPHLGWRLVAALDGGRAIT